MYFNASYDIITMVIFSLATLYKNTDFKLIYINQIT